MKLIFSPPSLDDLVRLLKAWRFWVLGALAGALLAAAVYAAAPPPYRARAVVLVDFNLEDAWPEDTDRQHFYYLEREARKLEEIAWSDAVLQEVADAEGRTTIGELREGALELSQPAEAGWQFYAEHADPARARSLASAWAEAFTRRAQASVGQTDGLNSFIEITLTQSAGLPVARSRPVSAYLLAGAVAAWFLGAISVLFLDFKLLTAAAPPPPSRRKSARKSGKK